MIYIDIGYGELEYRVRFALSLQTPESAFPGLEELIKEIADILQRILE